MAIYEANQAMDTLVRSLQSYHGRITINEVIKAGSLGHGTSVPGNYDLDIVIYSSSVEAQEVCRAGVHGWLRQLKTHLQEQNPRMLTNVDEKPHALNFVFKQSIEVDMLISPYWREPSELYGFLKRIPQSERFNFSSSASKWQVQFFKSKPNQVKEFIRRAKAWRNKKWPRGTQGKPKSFLLSVLVLRAYEIAERQVGQASTQRMALQTTSEVKKIVKSNYQADIYWEEYYRAASYPDLFPQSRPRIVDPANPSNNLHHTGICGHFNDESDYGEGGGRWDNFVRFVDSLDLTKSVDEIAITL